MMMMTITVPDCDYGIASSPNNQTAMTTEDGYLLGGGLLLNTVAVLVDAIQHVNQQLLKAKVIGFLGSSIYHDNPG